MKIYSLLLVKNEGDVIRASLSDACRWSDKVIVIDNGSSDDTWEIIQSMSQTEPRIVPFMRYEGGFHIGLRAKAYYAFRHEMSRDDWWCVRLDADEFFVGDVRTFLSNVPKRYRTVKKESTDYIITSADLDEIDWQQSFEQIRPLLQHSLAEKRQERRFMRHNPLYIWRETWRYPHPWGRVYPQPIAVDHYQYRSPEQMERRFMTRQQAKADGCGSFKHEQGQTWRDYIPAEERLLHQGRNIVKVVNEHEVVKKFARPTGLKRLIYSTIRKSKARRSYEYALLLPGMTPAPIRYHETYKHGLLTDSEYVSELSICEYTFRDLRNPSFPHREHILAEIGRFTARLHERGILHGDYSQGNILFHLDSETQQVHIEIVDLNRLHRYRKISMYRGCCNMERLDIEPAALQIMARAYAEEREMDAEQCIQLVLTHRWRKHKKK